MRIHLMLQLDVPVLGHVGLFPFLLHLAPCRQSIIDHEHDAVDGDLGKERRYEKHREFAAEIVALSGRDSDACEQGLKEGSCECEAYEEEHLTCRFHLAAQSA